MLMEGTMENTINPENEVKKLQDLVKKLEKQNELLRNKADAIGSPTHNANGTLPLTEANTNLNSIADIKSGKGGDARTKNSIKTLLDDVKVLEIQSEDSDDDTWLYQSPLKTASPDQKHVSPYDWVRQDFEHPGRDQETAKKSLLAKLDEVSRVNRNSMGSSSLMALQQPHHNHPNQPNHNYGSPDLLRGIEKLETSPRSQSPPLSQPHLSPRERRQSHEERMPAGLSRLEDVTDVQILAKMQEESLRQAMQMSPANSPRRISISPSSSENTLHRPASRSSSMSSTEGKSEDGDDRMGVVRRRPSFERIRKAGEGSEKKEIAPRGVPDGRNGDAKHNSVSRLRGPEAPEKPASSRNSLSNRTYVIHPPAPHPTPCTPPPTPMNQENSYPGEMAVDGNNSSSKIRQPSSIPNRAPSPRTLRQPSPTKLRGASPHRGSGIPVRASQMEGGGGGGGNRSGIPRPRSAVIGKSGIPAANKGSVVSPRGSVKTRDDSWREGCF